MSVFPNVLPLALAGCDGVTGPVGINAQLKAQWMINFNIDKPINCSNTMRLRKQLLDSTQGVSWDNYTITTILFFYLHLRKLWIYGIYAMVEEWPSPVIILVEDDLRK